MIRSMLVSLFILGYTQATLANDIKDYVQYQHERLRTYEDAVKYHQQTKKPVIVWVGDLDDDAVFKAWQQTRDLGYHVFVKSHAILPTGVVIGTDQGGVFARLRHFPSLADVATKIKEALSPKPVVSGPVTFPEICIPGSA